MNVVKYSDEILCDVVPMHASHFWGVDGSLIGKRLMMGLEIGLLVPLSPKQVYDDQIKLKKKSVRMGLTSDSDCMKKKQSTNVLKP
jgi:hypothetical protein